MSCKNVCSLCPNLAISSAVTFATGAVLVNIPAGSYANGQKVCLVVAQAIPTTATVDAPVYITIGSGPVQYPLQRRNGIQVTAREIRTRTRYTTCVVTSTDSGVFRLTGNLCDCLRGSTLPAINGDGTPAST